MFEDGINFNSSYLSPLNNIILTKGKITRIDIRNMKRYFFLNSVTGNIANDDISELLPTLKPIELLDVGFNSTWYQYSNMYVENNIFKHTKYTLLEFMNIDLRLISKILKFCEINNIKESNVLDQLAGEVTDE